MTDLPNERTMANAIRALAMDAVQAANSGHPGMPMGMADAATVLFARFINLDPTTPHWADRDRFVLSAGHGSMLQYALHHLIGYHDMTMDELRRFRQLGSRTAGHPEYGHAAGIETTTGPLGQGLANAVGMALAERLMQARFGDDLVDHWTYVIAGDGCLMEGISHEAVDMAGHLRLGRLVVLWDDNEISIDGATSLATSTDQAARFDASGWHVVRGVDGHDHDAVAKAIEAARKDQRPSLICCRTTIGFGAPTKAGTAGAHGAPLGADEIAGARAALGWDHPPFEMPADIYEAWSVVARRGLAKREAWQQRLENSPRQEEWNAFHAPDLARLRDAMVEHKKRLSENAPAMATRKASEAALEVINATIPQTIGGSADLTGSNNTRTSQTAAITADDFTGRYIHYGVREHAMAAVMNGLALHGPFIPYGGTFLVFTDYARPAIRLSALMGVRAVYVMTHDSIGLGEDGPTHQPVEHLSALRAMPNLLVLRPADAVETAEAWEIALSRETGPTVLALSRQNLPTLRTRHEADNLTARGAYLLRDTDAPRDVTLVATGSEVEIVEAASVALAEEGIAAAVVSAPCLELLARQPRSYQDDVLGDVPRVIVEAGVAHGWHAWMRPDDAFVGLSGFGVSAPYKDAYAHLGITFDSVVDAARSLLQNRRK